MPPTAPSRPQSPLAWLALALLATFAPLIAFNVTPSATLFNQLSALFGAGGVLFLMASDDRPALRFSPAAAALLLLLIAPAVSHIANGLPLSLTLSSSALIGTALLLVLAAQGLDDEARRRWFAGFCWALLAAGLLSLVVSIVQVFLPDLADGRIIARSGIAGRAVGNMRQPNHLASLLMWSSVAAVYLVDQDRRLARFGLPALLFGFVFAVVLSASRTGMVGVFLLAIWGLLDRRLARSSRWSLIATPLMMAVSWYAMYLWANSGGGHAFGAESRLASEGAGSPERMKILANAWALVKANPWTGVGWGEFNLAWTMTPFPDRPVAFFDHSHNIVMQLAVELGMPMCALIVGLLCWGLIRALRDSMREAMAPADAIVRRCAFMLVLMIGLHSLLEYPLWYAYFLLPAALAFGLALGPREQARPGPTSFSRPALPWAAAGLLIIAGTLYSIWDYYRVVVIYVPPEHTTSLPERIEAGRHSTFFAMQADYAAATSLPPGEHALRAARSTGHNLIDARLMMAWAQSLHAAGDDDRARYVVERLKEFRNATGNEWLAICEVVTQPDQQPFQCAPPKREYGWREMR